MSAAHDDVIARATTLTQELGRFIHDRKPPAAVHAACSAVSSGSLTVSQLYSLVLVPLMRTTGERWQAGEEEVWEEHYTTAVVRTIVEGMYDHVTVRSAETTHNGHTAVLACPEEEHHDLGLRMLADRFTLAGYRVHFLGAALPLDQLLAAIGDLGADTVVLSASTHYHRLRLREYVDAMHEAYPAVRVIAGGPAFARGHSDWSDDEVPDIDAFLGDMRTVE